MWKRPYCSFLCAILSVVVLFTACGTPAVTPTSLSAPKRVAALLGSFAEVWCLAGGNLIATTQDAFEDYGLDEKGVRSIGGAHSPNLELILASNPDLVLASSGTASHLSLKEPLEQAGIQVLYFEVTEFSQYLEMLKTCTDLTGRRDLYEKNGLQVKEQIEEVKTRVANANLPQNKREILLLRASSGFVKAKGSGDTVLGCILKDLGCINLADSETSLLTTLSEESILVGNPYRIFAVPMGDGEKAKQSLEHLLTQNPVMKHLSAVKENRVHTMDPSLFHQKPNAKWGDAYEQAASILLQP